MVNLHIDVARLIATILLFSVYSVLTIFCLLLCKHCFMIQFTNSFVIYIFIHVIGYPWPHVLNEGGKV